MRTEKKTQMALVEGETPTELMVRFNEMMDRMCQYTHGEPVIDLSSLTAYVLYTEETVVVETREDEHIIKGERFFCSDCKFFHENKCTDGSSDCPHRHGMTLGFDNVCKEFWDAYENREDILYVPRNKDGSVNKTTSKGKRYLKLKSQGVVD